MSFCFLYVALCFSDCDNISIYYGLCISEVYLLKSSGEKAMLVFIWHCVDVVFLKLVLLEVVYNKLNC